MHVGQVRVIAISDGTFAARPSYFGDDLSSNVRPDFFDRDGAAFLPIGCFVVGACDRAVLVDAGLGPHAQQLRDGMLLVGGQLMTGLRAAGVERSEITDVVCTHLHSDHIGWLFDLDSAAVFPNATIWLGASDWSYFVDANSNEIAPHILRGLVKLADRDGVRLISADSPVAPGLIARLAPGHTPGSLYVDVVSDGDRLLLLGDAITCPIQLEEPEWHSFGDVDPARAAATRHHLWHELTRERTRGVGAHFPELRPGSVARTSRTAWLPD